MGSSGANTCSGGRSRASATSLGDPKRLIFEGQASRESLIFGLFRENVASCHVMACRAV